MNNSPAVLSRSSEPALIEARQPGDPTPIAAGKGRLLIVDDIRENREILRRRFERHGFRATEASGGLEALALIEREAFDLVLLDMMMPGLSGLEVLARIRAKHSPGLLPVVMVTAKSQSEDVVDALNRGANDYITKPVDFSIALARVLTHRASTDSASARYQPSASRNGRYTASPASRGPSTPGRHVYQIVAAIAAGRRASRQVSIRWPWLMKISGASTATIAASGATCSARCKASGRRGARCV